MFYKALRKKYKGITKNDVDIQRYFEVMNVIQDEGYDGIMGFLQDLGHKWVSRYTQNGISLEIGFGRGRQSLFYKGDPDQYYPLEINAAYIYAATWGKFPNATIGNALSLPFPDNYFDNVVTIYNLEHIMEINVVFKEIKRVMKKEGKLIVALPCEGGFIWNLGRMLTSRRIFQKKFGINYDKVIAFEHVHTIFELQQLLKQNFILKTSKYFPFFIPINDINVIYCSIYNLK